MADVSNLKQVQGRESNGNAIEEAARVERSRKSRLYSVLAATIATGQTNRAVTTDLATFFSALGDSALANFLEIYTDAQITIRVRTKAHGSTSDTPTANLPAITLRANTLRLIDYLADITEIYITNASGGNAAVEIVAI